MSVLQPLVEYVNLALAFVMQPLCEYFSFMTSQLVKLISPAGIWCIFDKFGLRIIIMLVSSGIIAFAIPNIFDQSECKTDRDAYIKSLFQRQHQLMIANSRIMLVLAALTILTYLSIWNALPNSDFCTQPTSRAEGPERFAPLLLVLTLSTMVVATYALKQKIFCLKHKQ